MADPIPTDQAVTRHATVPLDQAEDSIPATRHTQSLRTRRLPATQQFPWTRRRTISRLPAIPAPGLEWTERCQWQGWTASCRRTARWPSPPPQHAAAARYANGGTRQLHARSERTLSGRTTAVKL